MLNCFYLIHAAQSFAVIPIRMSLTILKMGIYLFLLKLKLRLK